MPHLGEKLKSLRLAKDYNQPQMAEFLGVSPRSYQDIEKTGKVAKADVLNAILKKTGLDTQNNAHSGQQITTGFVPADQVIADLRKDKEWLQAILNTSLATIVQGQQQTGVQLKALSWFSALVAAGGDEKKAQESISAINNKIAFYEGVDGEGDNSEKVDSTHTGGKRQRKA